MRASKVFTLMTSALALGVGCVQPLPAAHAGLQPPPGGVRLVSASACGGQDCFTVAVDCLGLNERTASIRTARIDGARGAVVFTTGGSGRGYYGGRRRPADTPSGETVQFFRERGYETFEVAWQGDWGWATDNAGAGFKAVMCAYAEVVRWIAGTIAANPGVMGATGNSGGSMQIGYGLAVHGLDALLDAVVLSGGPPTADAWDVCFAKGPQARKTGGTSVLMDHVLGWLDHGDYCQWGAGPETAQDTARRESIVSDEPGERRDTDYPSTVVSFVEGEKDLANLPRAQTYYDAITSEKTWDVVPGAPHGVYDDPDGAVAIRERLFERLEALAR